MNWRRGLLLAGIHLVVAGTLVTWQESRLWHQERGAVDSLLVPTVHAAMWQEGEQTVPFDPCNGGYVCFWERPQHLVASEANPLVYAVTAWGIPCPTQWTLEGMLASHFGRSSWKTDVGSAVGFCMLVFIQWLLVGGFPLIHPRRWWWEPGAMITVFTVIAFALVPFSVYLDLVTFPLVFAWLGWLWWFILLVLTALRAGWRMVKPTKPQAA